MGPCYILRDLYIARQSVFREIVLNIRHIRHHNAVTYHVNHLLLHLITKRCICEQSVRHRKDKHLIRRPTRKHQTTILDPRKTQKSILIHGIITVATQRINPFLRVGHIRRMSNSHRHSAQRLSDIGKSLTLRLNPLGTEYTWER